MNFRIVTDGDSKDEAGGWKLTISAVEDLFSLNRNHAVFGRAIQLLLIPPDGQGQLYIVHPDDEENDGFHELESLRTRFSSKP